MFKYKEKRESIREEKIKNLIEKRDLLNKLKDEELDLDFKISKYEK